MKNKERDRAFRYQMIFLAAVLLTMLLGGCTSLNPPNPNEKTRMTPAFAFPCGADNSCTALAPCADSGFDRCTAFDTPPGLRRKLSGVFGKADFRAQTLDSDTGRPVSLWHDVPLVVSDDDRGLIVNAFFEVNKGSQAKVELDKWEPHNPMRQDRYRVAGQGFTRPRYYAWSPAPGNYGALPRTWENVLEPDPLTGFPGDTDPIDVVDLGAAASPLGLVYKVKVLGALGMIDGTDLETDWKIFVINIKDPRAENIDDISDIPQPLIDEWGIFWRFYKTATGLEQNFFYDPESTLGFSSDPVWLGAGDARMIIESSSAAYRKLVSECLGRKLSKPFWVPGCLP